MLLVQEIMEWLWTHLQLPPAPSSSHHVPHFLSVGRAVSDELEKKRVSWYLLIWGSTKSLEHRRKPSLHQPLAPVCLMVWQPLEANAKNKSSRDDTCEPTSSTLALHHTPHKSYLGSTVTILLIAKIHGYPTDTTEHLSIASCSCY